MVAFKHPTMRRKTPDDFLFKAAVILLILFSISLSLNARSAALLASTTSREATVVTPLSSHSVATTAITTPSPENLLSYRQSYGFFDDISDRDWLQIYQKRAREAHHYNNPFQPNAATQYTQVWNFHNQEPVFSCPHVHKV